MHYPLSWGKSDLSLFSIEFTEELMDGLMLACTLWVDVGCVVFQHF